MRKIISKKNRNLISSSLIGLVLLFFISGCFVAPTFHDPTNFQFEGYKPRENKLSFSLDVEVYNPNFYGIKVRRSALEVFFDDEKIGTGKIRESFKMKRKNSTTCLVPVDVLLEKGAAFKLMRKAFKKEVKIRLSGRLRVSIMGIPSSQRVDQTKSVNLKDLGVNFGSILGL